MKDTTMHPNIPENILKELLSPDFIWTDFRYQKLTASRHSQKQILVNPEGHLTRVNVTVKIALHKTDKNIK